MMTLYLRYQDPRGVTLSPFDDDSHNGYEGLIWRDRHWWPVPLFAEWLDYLGPKRYIIEEWIKQDHMGDDVIVVQIISFKRHRDALLFKLRWM